MMTITLAVSLMLSTEPGPAPSATTPDPSPSVAEVVMPQGASLDTKLRYVDSQLEKARGRRTRGIVFTVVGGMLVAGGLACIPIAYAVGAKGGYDREQTTSALLGLGAGVGGLGLLGTGLGIVFWAGGSTDLTRYEREKDKLILSVTPQPNGLLIAGRF